MRSIIRFNTEATVSGSSHTPLPADEAPRLDTAQLQDNPFERSTESPQQTTTDGGDDDVTNDEAPLINSAQNIII